MATRRSRPSRRSVSPTARARATTIRRRCSSSACRARARRSPSKFSPPTPKPTAPASARRWAGSPGGSAAGETADSIARIAALDPAALDAEAEAYLKELHALAPDKSRIVDKMPGNYHYVWLIALLFPNAKIIHCVRDPRDIGFSIFTFRFHGEHGYAHDLADLGWMIGEQERLMRHWKAALPMPILTLRLDDWVKDFDATLARVLDHRRPAAGPGLRALLSSPTAGSAR